MTDLSPDTLNFVREAAVRTAPKAQKFAYLRRHGWKRLGGSNVWSDRDGRRWSFGAAVSEQLYRDQQAP